MTRDLSDGSAGERLPLAPLLTVAEVAEILRLSERHVRRMIKSGEIPVIRFGTAVRVLRETIETMIGGHGLLRTSHDCE